MLYEVITNLNFGNPFTVFGAVIFTRADRADIRELSDLDGKSFGAVSADAFGGFQMAWRELKQAGVDPYTDLSRLQFFDRITSYNVCYTKLLRHQRRPPRMTCHPGLQAPGYPPGLHGRR